jgi:predicted O-methyltransferase YrrM
MIIIMINQIALNLAEKAKLFKNSQETNYEFFLYHLRDMGVANALQNYQEELPFVLADSYGLVQEPKQFAFLLSFLSQQKCQSYCEIGVAWGFSSVMMLSVLARNNKDIKALTIDPFMNPSDYVMDIFKNLGVDVEHISETSESVKGQEFDIVHIDGDHRYPAVKQDWENIGKHSKICIFHDIAPSLYGSGPNIVFKQIKGLKTKIETTNDVMGIGIAFPKASTIMNL